MLYWLVIGLVAGALAKFIMPGDDPGGILITIALGIAGAFVGGFLGNLVGIAASSTLGSVAVATGGALVLLFGYRQLKA